MNHKNGNLETRKHAIKRKNYNKYLNLMNEKNIPFKEVIEEVGAYIGDLSLIRILTFYELYKLIGNIPGHIAEVGVFKGSGSIFFAKLMKIFEPNSIFMVHGFDWFEGSVSPSKKDSDLVYTGGYKNDYESVKKLIKAQDLSKILKIHKLDLRKDLKLFFNSKNHLMFKLVFMDAGHYEVMDQSIPLFYKRLTPGGIMIFDQYSHELAPGEVSAIKKHLPNAELQCFPWGWMPNAYFIKKK